MDPLLNSNASSAMNSILKDVDTQRNPFSYRYAAKSGDSLSGVSRTMQVVNAVNTVAHSSAVDFHIPKQGLLAGMHVMFKKTISNTSGGPVSVTSTGGGLDAIDRIQLISQGRILADLTSEALSSLVAAQPYGSRKTLGKMINMDLNYEIADGASFEYVSRIPCLFSQTESLEKVYDTLFTAPLVLRVHVGAQDAFSGTGLTFTAAPTVEVLCDFVREDSEMHQARLSKDYSSGSLQRIQWATEHLADAQANLASGASRTFEIKTNNYISELMVFLSPAADKFNKVELTDIKIEANGQTIVDLPGNAELLKHYQPSDDWEYGAVASDETQATPAKNNYRYNFGLSNDSRRVFGGVASRELSNFKVTVKNGDSSTVTAAQIHVVAKYYQIESIEAASGKITTSISS